MKLLRLAKTFFVDRLTVLALLCILAIGLIGLFYFRSNQVSFDDHYLEIGHNVISPPAVLRYIHLTYNHDELDALNLKFFVTKSCSESNKRVRVEYSGLNYYENWSANNLKVEKWNDSAIELDFDKCQAGVRSITIRGEFVNVNAGQISARLFLNIKKEMLSNTSMRVEHWRHLSSVTNFESGQFKTKLVNGDSFNPEWSLRKSELGGNLIRFAAFDPITASKTNVSNFIVGIFLGIACSVIASILIEATAGTSRPPKRKPDQ